MSEIPMMTTTTKETVDHYALNAGGLAVNVDMTGITTAEQLVQYIRDNPDKVLGATSGGTTIAENRETWNPERNGRRVNAKGEQYFAGADPMIKATLIEQTPANIKRGSGAADITGDGTTHVEITPRAEFRANDYADTVLWFTNYGTKGIIYALLRNALCTKGINWSVDDKKVATSEIEFHGHSDGVLFDDGLPIKYGILYNTAA